MGVRRPEAEELACLGSFSGLLFQQQSISVAPTKMTAVMDKSQDKALEKSDMPGNHRSRVGQGTKSSCSHSHGVQCGIPSVGRTLSPFPILNNPAEKTLWFAGEFLVGGQQNPALDDFIYFRIQNSSLPMHQKQRLNNWSPQWWQGQYRCAPAVTEQQAGHSFPNKSCSKACEVGVCALGVSALS